MRPWWQAFEGRLERELEAFSRLATTHQLVRGPKHGVVAIQAMFPSRRGEVELLTVYPDSFPFLRPHVLALSLALGRHQNPFGKNLCLLDRSTRAWRPRSDTAAGHIAEQLDRLFATVDGDRELRTREEVPQGEPLSAFIPNTAGAVVLLSDEALHLPNEHSRGEIKVGLLDGRATLGLSLRGGLIDVDVRPRKGKFKRLARPDHLLKRLIGGQTLRGRWLRVELRANNAPSKPTADDFLAYAAQIDPEWTEPQYHVVDGGEVAVLGLVYREEVRLDEFEDAWLFVVRERRRVSPRGLTDQRAYVIKGERLSEDDLRERIPQLGGLAGKTVALAGLGALGAPAAIELAKAQLGRLRLLEFDAFEVGNLVRWPLGLEAAGHPKLAALARFLRGQYPGLAVETFDHQIGGLTDPDTSERALLESFLSGADLLLDLTAEIGINHLFSALATEAAVPQVYAWATEGGWGGGVARCVPGKTGCWFCLQLHIRDHTIDPAPFDHAGTVQPRGCATATFTGAGFDMLPVVAQASRLVAQTLLRDKQGGYPDSVDDVMILALRTRECALAAPEWTTYKLAVHRECPYCPQP